MNSSDYEMCSCLLLSDPFYEWNNEPSLFWLVVGLLGGVIGTLCLINTCFCLYLCLKRQSKNSYSLKERVSGSSSMEDTTMRLQTIITLDPDDEEQHKITSFETSEEEQTNKPQNVDSFPGKELATIESTGTDKLVQVSIPSIPSPSAATKSVKFDIPTIIIPPATTACPDNEKALHNTTETPSSAVGNTNLLVTADTAAETQKPVKSDRDHKEGGSTDTPTTTSGDGEVVSTLNDAKEDSDLDNMFKDILDFSLPTTTQVPTGSDVATGINDGEYITSIEL